MRREHALDRRTLIGLAAGAVGTAVLGARSPRARAGAGERLDNGTIDPLTGLPLRGGFAGVFETLASYGYRGVEFAGYTQGANGPTTIQQIRALLDAHGPKAVGTHLSLGRLSDPATLELELDRAETLGMAWIGTANAPTNASRVAAWEAAAGAALRPAPGVAGEHPGEELVRSPRREAVVLRPILGGVPREPPDRACARVPGPRARRRPHREAGGWGPLRDARVGGEPGRMSVVVGGSGTARLPDATR